VAQPTIRRPSVRFQFANEDPTLIQGGWQIAIVNFGIVTVRARKTGVVVRMPRRSGEPNQAISIPVGVLKAQDCAVTEINLDAEVNITDRPANVAARHPQQIEFIFHRLAPNVTIGLECAMLRAELRPFG